MDQIDVKPFLKVSITVKLVKFIIILLLLPRPSVLAQDSDNAYRKLISETITNIEQIYKIKVLDEKGLIEGKELDYADWRIGYDSPEKSLAQILAPFDLTFYKESDKVYAIRKLDYPRKSVEEGEQHLNYLSALYHNLDDWKKRKGDLKSCMLDQLELDSILGFEPKAPLLTSYREYDGYKVQNFALEVLPGLFTTGSIYRPLKVKEKLPIILSPNGHFGKGRYGNDQQSRNAMLAKMGAVVASYDLFAWGESLLQFDAEDHRKSIAHTIQTLNGIKILDYLVSLSDTDPERIGITGGSGGGSQTILLTALDERIKVSAPVVMVSSHFAGGCPCESGKGIHLCGTGTNNAEISAMAAPRPQLVISDGKDWTHTFPELEKPFIQNIYAFYGKEAALEHEHFEEEGHDYGLSKRLGMYSFMASHLGLEMGPVKGNNGELKESGLVIEDESLMKVFGPNGENLPSHAIKGLDALNMMLAAFKTEKN
ncbi:acetylxylan esterase [Anditalea andensis]|nr:acetylxylan esterase [Anditalea andensis]